jgi:hypothetical protein
MKKINLSSIIAAGLIILDPQISYTQNPITNIPERDNEEIAIENFEYKNLEEEYQKKAQVYEKAAEKRRNAAEAQKKRALELLEEAKSRKLRVYMKIEDERKNQEIAGELELKAGDLEGKAYRNYECAANNLYNAIKSYRLLKEDKENKLPRMIKMQSDDTKNAKAFYEKTIESYLTAAITFSVNNADNPEKEAEANIRAAIELEYKAGKND